MFLGNIDTPDATAAGTVTSLIDFLTVKGIPLETLYGLGSDGASVMTGVHGGVGVKLRNGWDETPAYAPYLLHIHCVAHR